MDAPRSAKPRARAGGFALSTLATTLCAALVAGCGDESLPRVAAGTGDGLAGSASSSGAGGGGGAAVSSSSSGTGGAPTADWWKHLVAPDPSAGSWMAVPGAMTVDAHGHVVITGRANAPVAFESDV